MLAAGCSCGSNSNTPLNVEKANIVFDAFPVIDSAGLYIAQMDGLFADQGLHVTIEPSQATQTTQTEINGQSDQVRRRRINHHAEHTLVARGDPQRAVRLSHH